MRTFIIIAVIVIILYFGYTRAKKILDNFEISDPEFLGADLPGLFRGTGFNTVDLGTTITNKNDFSVSVSGLYIEIYYKGMTVGKSTVPHEKFVIPANGSVDVRENMTLALGNAIEVGVRLLAKQPVEFTYMVKATIFGWFPLTHRDKFTV